jgi:hypothetical protein
LFDFIPMDFIKPLSQLRGNGFDWSAEAPVNGYIERTIFNYFAGWIRAEIVAVFPVVLWPDGPGTKASTTIRADILQDRFDARTTERAFKRADHRVRGIWWKGDIAALASRS